MELNSVKFPWLNNIKMSKHTSQITLAALLLVHLVDTLTLFPSKLFAEEVVLGITTVGLVSSDWHQFSKYHKIYLS